MKILEKICLGIIFLGIALSLVTPLLLNNNLLFPYITTKVFWFRIIVEIMLLAYLLLVFLNKKYQPKINSLLLIICFFILVAFLSSFLGSDFYGSFWGNMERGEGLILWLHLLVYFIILTGVLTSEIWFYFFDFSLVISLFLSLFALSQAFHLKFILSNTGERVEATIGNPAFLAVYLFFQLAFAACLFIQRRNLLLRIYYSILSVLFIYIIFKTQTRGAIIGLAVGFLTIFLLRLFKMENGKRKIIIPLFILIIGLSSFSLYANRQSNWMKKTPILNRISSISLEERTAQTRLAAWQAAWQGWKQHFWLGNGLENFNIVFNKNFPPMIYEDEGSAVWFDRAHNLIFDRGTTVGIIGLLVYLIFLIYPIYYFAKKFFQEKEQNMIYAVFISLIVAFLVQNLLVFEAITTYIILFFTWAFLAGFLPPHLIGANFVILVPKTPAPIRCGGLPQRQLNIKFLNNNKIWLGLFIIYLICLWPILSLVNIKPIKANTDIIKAINSDFETVSFFEIVNQFKKALESGTYGLPEYRIQFIEFIDNQLANVGEIFPEVKPVLDYADEQIEKQIQERPNDAKSYLLAMRHYNYTFAAYPEKKFERLQKALSFLPKLEELSPTRPHIYQEAGYSNLYAYRNYKEQDDVESADKFGLEAEKYFQKVIDLNPKVVESYINLIMLYFDNGQTDKIKEIIDQMDKNQADFRQQRHLLKLINLSISNESYQWSAFFHEEFVKLEPDNVDIWVRLALSYVYSGEKEKAIETANRIKEFGGSYVGEAELFIENVNNGYYEKDNSEK